MIKMKAKTRRRRKKQSFSKRIFEKHYKIWKDDNSYDYLGETQKEVFDAYNCGKYCRNKLLVLYAELSFYLEYRLVYPFTIVSALIGGIMVWLITGITDNYIKVLHEPIDPNQPLIVNLILSIIPAILYYTSLIITGLISYYIFKKLYYIVKRDHNDFYALYIVPFERQVIRRKLLRECGFDVEGVDQQID